jgi:hypothetical protein
VASNGRYENGGFKKILFQNLKQKKLLCLIVLYVKELLKMGAARIPMTSEVFF